MSSFPISNNQAFDPAEFLTFATWLQDTKPALSAQVLRRTIIGRAYYAALICARNATGVSTSGKDGHVEIVKALKKQDADVGNKLDSLRLKRHNADYKQDDITSRDVEMSIHDAKKVLKYLGQLATSSPLYSCDYLDETKFLSASLKKSK